jgi:Na+/H+ antiporter NhaC
MADMAEHPYGWLSILPPLVAIVLAIATRRVVVSLIAGIFVGALVTRHGNPWLAICDTWETHLWNTLIDQGKMRVYSFTLLMGALIGVITQSGGMQGLIDLVSPWARTRRRGQLATWFLGMLIFFDDYANTILLGSTLKPIADRLKISREKLSYLVDSTAAPVAGLALVSTWVAVEIDYVRSGLENVGADTGLAFDIFIASIPYRFYILGALLLVFLISASGRDFGPMLAAERKRQSGPTGAESDSGLYQNVEVQSSHWLNAILPIVLTLAVVIVLIYRTGAAGFESTVGVPLREIIGAGDSTLALQYGALIGLLFAGSLAIGQKLLSFEGVIDASLRGARIVLPAIAILWCASTVSRLTGNQSVDGQPSTAFEYKDYRLYTGEFLKDELSDRFSNDEGGASAAVQLLPTVVFVLSAFVAFCTGTSWGTMGILLPMVVTLAHALLTEESSLDMSSNAIFLSSIGGVLAGAVFGDHCSPLSDTTVLSSQSSGCDHIAHVWTQMPYAMAAATASVVAGTLPLGWGVSVWALLPLQAVLLIGTVFVLGRKVREDEPSDN